MPGGYRFIGVFTAVLLLSACSGGQSAQEHLMAASPGISEGAENDNLLTIKRDSLGREYLLHGAYAMQRGYGEHISNPTVQPMRSRIVTFQEQGMELLMLETNEGFMPGDEIPSHALITTFPIREKSEALIVFDFNAGMSVVIMSWDWFVSDYQGTVIAPAPSLAIESSYIREVTTDEEAISVTQTVSVRNGSYVVPIEVTYYLTPYQANPGYKPVVSPGFDYLGFFEANPLVQADFGLPFTYISRWDISRPVTYYISRAVPEEFRETLKEGVLYWNKVFGMEVLRAELAPEGMTAPDFKHNIIQWHTDLHTGAYAAAQLDPRTAEILHSMIFISSSYADMLRGYRIPEYKRRLEAEDYVKPPEDSLFCRLSLDDLAREIYLYRDQIGNLSPERITAIAKDYMRNTVAHEVGHTLGLRHNFAASTVSDWSGAEEREIIRAYFEDGKLPDDIEPPANSVMDYLNLASRIIQGALIKKDDYPVFPYDAYAIGWAYFRSDEDPVYDGHPFCTDTHTLLFSDCGLFDGGRHLVERRVDNYRQAFEKLPFQLSEVYLSAKANINKMLRKPVEESTPPAQYLASGIAERWAGLLSLLAGEVRLVSVYRADPDYTDIDKEEIDAKTLDWLDYEIAYAGGMGEVLKLIGPDYFLKTVSAYPLEFNDVITSDSFLEAPLPEGGTVQFIREETDYMKMRAAGLFPEMEKYLVGYIIRDLAGSFNMIEQIETLEEIVAGWIGFVITATGDGGRLFNFRYPVEIRQEAVNLLMAPGPLPRWYSAYVQQMAERLHDVLEEVFGMPPEEVDVTRYPREEQEAIMAELEIYNKLLMLSGYTTDIVDVPQEEIGDEAATGWLKRLLN